MSIHPQPTELDAAPTPHPHPQNLRRILIGTDTYHPDVNGAAYFTYRLTIGPARRGHDVHVVFPNADAPASTRDEDGVTVHRLRSFRTPVHPTFHVCLPPTAARETAAILRAVEPDIVHVQGHFPIGRSVLRAAHRQTVPVVATNHFMPENLLAYVHVPAAVRRIACELAWRDFTRVFNQADDITTPTPIAADLIRRRGLRPRVQAVSCGIDLERFHVRNHAELTDPKNLSDSPTILFVGRLDEEKHVHELIGALPMIRRHVDAQVVLVGTGNQQRRLSDLSQKLGVARNVHFLGFVPDDELPAIYRGCDVFVMPGVAELQSLVTLEAMASGLPVIAANAMALPHLVHPGVNGYLYRPGDLEELAAHVEAVLVTQVDRRRMGRASREIARRHDDTVTFVRFESPYTTCIGSPAVAETLASL